MRIARSPCASIGVVAALLAIAAGCSDPGAARIVRIDDGSVRGRLLETIARYDDGTAATSYELRIAGKENDVRTLVFRLAPDVMPNADVKVWGQQDGSTIFVERLELDDDVDDGIGRASQPLVGQAPLEPLKLAMALVDIGAGNTNPMITPDELQNRVFTNPDSTRAYYLENSYGMQPMTGKVVGSVLSYTMNTCDTAGMARTLTPMVDADVGQKSDVYLWYFQGRTASCAWSGLSSGINTYYNASAGCVVLAQEPAHSLGLAHSSSLVCGASSMLDDPNNGCMHNEYGSPYDTMGGGCRHFSAYHKTYRTYVQKCNVVRVRKSGTFNLFPTEKPCNGIQVLQVPMPHVRPFTNSGGGGGGTRNTQLAFYTVELRSPIGFDTGMKPSVLVYAATQFSFNTAPSRANMRGEHTWLLDMSPGGSNTARDGSAHALAPGQTFTDPAGGVSITTVGVSADIAQIKVEISGSVTVDGGTGDTVCVDGTPIAEPGPTSCGDDGGVPPPPPPPPPSDASRDARADGAGGAGPGTGGAPGTGGSPTGTGGSTTTTSTTGPNGTTSGGPTSTGAGGTTGAPRPAGGELQGGCACRTSDPSPHDGTRGLVAFGVALAALTRRRRESS
jgi:MYXO-CTERM domain-containing protein